MKTRDKVLGKNEQNKAREAVIVALLIFKRYPSLKRASCFAAKRNTTWPFERGIRKSTHATHPK